MKTPRFEELARRWAGKAEVYFVFSEEAHPRAAANDRLNGFAAQLAKRDADGDGSITLAEYGDMGPRFMFDAFDIDHDGVIRSYELLAARRIGQFADVDEAKTVDERLALAHRFRAEVPGAIPVLVDGIDNSVAKAYGELPNSAYVIGRDRKVTLKLAWAAVGDVERELARLAGEPPPAVERVDLGPIAKQLAGARPVLVEFTAPGCDACARTEKELADPDIASALGRFEVVKLGVELDPAWRLFEQLDLAATPAFVMFDRDGSVRARSQGFVAREQLLAFLTK